MNRVFRLSYDGKMLFLFRVCVKRCGQIGEIIGTSILENVGILWN